MAILSSTSSDLGDDDWPRLTQVDGNLKLPSGEERLHSLDEVRLHPGYEVGSLLLGYFSKLSFQTLY